MIKFLTLIVGFWLFVCSPVEGQSGKLTLEEKIKQDIALMDKMIRNLERGTENIYKLKVIDDKIHRIWAQSQDTILIGEKPFTEHIYSEAKVVIEEFLPDDAASLVKDIQGLKLRYSQINGNEKAYKKLKNVDFKNLKKRYQKGSKSFGEKLRALMRLKRFMNQKLSNESTDITGMLMKGGELLTIIDEYAVEMGMESLSDEDLIMLKDDPSEFLIIKAQKHLDNYKMGKEEFKYLRKMKGNLRDSLYQIEQLYNLTQTENKKLLKENEAIVAQSKAEQQKLQQEQNILKYQLAEQQQLVQSLRNERSTISKDVNALSNKRTVIKEDVSALNARLVATADSLNLQKDKLVYAQKNLTATKYETEKLYSTVDSLTIAKAQIKAGKEIAERGRMLFLISSIVLLLGLLIMLGYERFTTQKAYNEKQALNEKLEEKNKQLEVQADQLEEKNEQLGFMLRELNHRTKNNLQLISSIVGMQAMSVEGGKVKETLQNIKERIHAIGLMHKGMYSTDFDKQVHVNMQTFINDLTNSLKNAFQYGKKITIHKEVKNIFILSDYAVPIGLIINEVITNAFKHAFPKHPNPELDIVFKYKNKEQKHLFLSIEDNGRDVDKWDGKCPHKENMGGLLVRMLTQQLEGKYKYSKGKKGFRFVMTFPVKNALGTASTI